MLYEILADLSLVLVGFSICWIVRQRRIDRLERGIAEIMDIIGDWYVTWSLFDKRDIEHILFSICMPLIGKGYGRKDLWLEASDE